MLQSHPEVVEAAKTALDRYGNGLSSVRFICGTQVKKIVMQLSIKLIETALLVLLFEIGGGGDGVRFAVLLKFGTQPFNTENSL